MTFRPEDPGILRRIAREQDDTAHRITTPEDPYAGLWYADNAESLRDIADSIDQYNKPTAQLYEEYCLQRGGFDWREVADFWKHPDGGKAIDDALAAIDAAREGE